MPVAAPKPCRHPGCPALVRNGAYCEEHRRVVDKFYDQRRASSTGRGYNYRWQKARATHLRKNPLCRMCGDEGLVTPAVIVDHIVPHRGDQDLFWDKTNWQSLCKWHHDSAKQAEERSGG